MKIIYLILAFVAGAVLFWAVNLPRHYENYTQATVLQADRNYWREIASSREAVCRKRGGEYKTSGFSSTFGSEPDKINWSCKEFDINE